MKTIIIVEGKSDTRRLKEIYPDVVTFQTSGLGLDDEKIAELQRLEASGVELICFTDPDYPGERIREKLSANLINLKHAYVAREFAKGKKGKVGIESATTEEIKRALNNLYELGSSEIKYDPSFMQDFGLTGNKVKREAFCDKLGIAYGNNKKVLKQLNSFAIDPKLVSKVLGELDESKS